MQTVSLVESVRQVIREGCLSGRWLLPTSAEFLQDRALVLFG
jgi:hypothetical protein